MKSVGIAFPLAIELLAISTVLNLSSPIVVGIIVSLIAVWRIRW